MSSGNRRPFPCLNVLIYASKMGPGHAGEKLSGGVMKLENSYPLKCIAELPTLVFHEMGQD